MGGRRAICPDVFPVAPGNQTTARRARQCKELEKLPIITRPPGLNDISYLLQRACKFGIGAEGGFLQPPGVNGGSRSSHSNV